MLNNGAVVVVHISYAEDSRVIYSTLWFMNENGSYLMLLMQSLLGCLWSLRSHRPTWTTWISCELSFLKSFLALLLVHLFIPQLFLNKSCLKMPTIKFSWDHNACFSSLLCSCSLLRVRLAIKDLKEMRSGIYFYYSHHLFILSVMFI